MPTFRTRIINKHFQASSESDADGADKARAQALDAALRIGAEEICKGESFFGAEITVECDGKTVERMMVAIGASPLQ